MKKQQIQTEKVLLYLEKKLKPDQLILSLQNIFKFKQHRKVENYLAITTTQIYFFHHLSLKEQLFIRDITCLTLTPFKQQLIIWEKEGRILVEAQWLVKIVDNILYAREKFLECQKNLTVMIEDCQNLESVIESEQKGKGFWNFLWKKDSKLNQRVRSSGQAFILEVDHKTFAKQIGQTIYSQLYKQTRLLYINNQRSFRFLEQNYTSQKISELKWLYTHKTEKQQVLVRKIPKKSVGHDKKVAQMLINYKNSEYKEEILFSIETETHFEVIVGSEVGDRNCEDLLKNNTQLEEKDLRSIFIKLINMIQNYHTIFHSITPEQITMTSNGITISEVFSSLERATQLYTLSPQQLTLKQIPSEPHVIEEINLWKSTIILYELAYHSIPFPLEYLLNHIELGTTFVLNFPPACPYSLYFKEFLISLLRIEPKRRGGIGQESWKNKIIQKEWLNINKCS